MPSSGRKPFSFGACCGDNSGEFSLRISRDGPLRDDVAGLFDGELELASGVLCPGDESTMGLYAVDEFDLRFAIEVWKCEICA